MVKKISARAVLAGVLLGLLAPLPATAQQMSEGYQFLKAVRERDGDEATAKLNEPGTVVVNARDFTSGETGLHIVTQRRDLIWVKFLLQRGANPDVADKKGVTPLQIASSLGFVEGVETLVKAGANVDRGNSAGETPLMSAVHRRDTAMVRLLLANGADPDRSDNSGRTARDYALLMNGNGQILEEFRQADEKRKAAQDGRSYGPN
ncbi:MAG: ankyrin repeat domain-containing protein [Qipengyuania sp.]